MFVSPPNPPYDKVGVAPPMRHDILCIAVRIGNNIAKVGGEGGRTWKLILCRVGKVQLIMISCGAHLLMLSNSQGLVLR